MPPAILTIHHAVPPYAYSQMSTYENFFRHFFEKNHRARAIFENSQIETRHSVLTPDFYRQEHTIDERNRLYVEGACRLGAESIQGCLEELSLSPEDLDHFIVVSCTGYSNPGLEILIAKQLGMRRDIRRTSIVGMGCYAAFPGLARAFESVVTRPKTRTLLLAVEICSVTLQKDDSMENVVASALFADGAAAVVLGDHKNSQPGLPFPHLLDFETLTDYETVDDMGFFVTHSGFRIVLSAKIPSFIRQNIKNVVSTFLDRNGLSSKEVRFWAVHPGGGKILDYVQEELKLSDDQMAFSRHILSTHGNMSSPTVLFILDEIARRGGPRPGDFGMMLGFGPGLTIGNLSHSVVEKKAMDRAKLLLGRVIYLLIGLLFLGAGVGLEAGVGAETLLKFQIDPARSDVRFDGETRLHNLDGVAKAFQGEMEAPASLFGEGVSGRVVIDPSSIDTGNSLRDRQMRNRTLEVEKFPEIVFLIDGAESEGETVAQADSMNLILSGRLVLHGITQEKRFSVTVLREGEELVLSGRFSLHLSERQIPDPSTFFNHVRDELVAIFKFTLIPTE